MIPKIVDDILKTYLQHSHQQIYRGFINDIPPSSNHQYKQGMMYQKGGGRKFGVRLTAEAQAFRDRLILTNPGLRHVKPRGTMALLAVFYFPWVTAGRKVRTKDDDNLMKPFRDAVKIAMSVDDSFIFHTHAFKANSNHMGIRFWILDMGTTVDYYEP